MTEDLLSLSFDELESAIVGIGLKKFHTRQIFDWVHKKNISAFDDMTNISCAHRKELAEKFSLQPVKIIKEIFCGDDTVKFLSQLDDGNTIESVLMSYSYGNTVCVSSQVGCAMGCKFCASTVYGLKRNLTSGEMLQQVYLANKIKRISNVVIMGSGEPLQNYDNVIRFIKTLNSPYGLNIGQRHITLSTCGIVDKLYSLAKENLQITLAISLHAPNDSLRKQIMPIANKYSIENILSACQYYFDATKRRITFEYILIKDLNDHEKDAIKLAKLLRKLPCHVNLIPANKTGMNKFEKSDIISRKRFSDVLESFGLKVTVRRKLGDNINAACGQLRSSYINFDSKSGDLA